MQKNILLVMVLSAAMLAAASTRAAELRLKKQCRCDAPVVTLGDLADVFSADAQQAAALAAIELFPSPSGSRQRFVRVREIQDLLLARGVNLTEHRLSGSSRVAVSGGGNGLDASPGRPVSAAAVRRAEGRVRDAISRHLVQVASADTAWSVEPRLTPGQVRLLSNLLAKISLRGGSPPWTGHQQFEIVVDSADGRESLAIEAEVTLPPEAVVVVRSLSRGLAVHASDVELRRLAPGQVATDAFHRLEDVIGREATRAIPQGTLLKTNMVRAPLLVQRGDEVIVIARSAGIRVRTTARVREDGSLGDLVAVESLADRKTYFARVTAVREVEVYSRAVDAGGTARRTTVQR